MKRKWKRFKSGGFMGEKAVETIRQVPKRVAGVLAHPTSFPSVYGIGDLGSGAYRFLDFLAEAGQKIWQVLPIGPTGFGDSPYQAFSSFAGQPLLISPERLVEKRLLVEEDFREMPKWDAKKVDYGPLIEFKTHLLRRAYESFQVLPDTKMKEELQEFEKEHAFWLEDYALFMAGKDAHEGRSWLEWEDDLRDPDEEIKAKWAEKLSESIKYYKFIQFLFFEQWGALKRYANERGIQIVGDIPIFVAIDSADVWANKGLFQLDSKGYPTVVAGVPPDYFSATGQLWGNPLYDWKAMKQKEYRWWISRIKMQLKLVDYLRIDHFRGFETYWAVPYGEQTAIHGEWKKGPCEEFFFAVQKELGEDIPIFAEDLGIITPEVEKLRDQFGLPGMKILQFAFDNTSENNFLPHYYHSNCICYTGTHDNDTTIGWYQKASENSKNKCRIYMNSASGKEEEVCWDFIRTALGSTAAYAIIPMQDLLCKGSESRMNTPSMPGGNWAYRFEEWEMSHELAGRLRGMTQLYGR